MAETSVTPSHKRDEYVMHPKCDNLKCLFREEYFYTNVVIGGKYSAVDKVPEMSSDMAEKKVA